MWIYFKSILDRVTIIYFVDVYNVLKYTFTDRTDKLYVHIFKTDIVMAFSLVKSCLSMKYLTFCIPDTNVYFYFLCLVYKFAYRAFRKYQYNRKIVAQQFLQFYYTQLLMQAKSSRTLQPAHAVRWLIKGPSLQKYAPIKFRKMSAKGVTITTLVNNIFLCIKDMHQYMFTKDMKRNGLYPPS